MPTNEPGTILLAHDRWATGNMLGACASLDDAQFHQRFDIGPGSLHDTVTHILGAMRGWTDLLAGREVRFRLEDGTRTVAEFVSLHQEISDEFATQARDMEGAATGERAGKTYTFTRGAVVTHVLTHSVHHRAQCLNMFRALGVDPLPPVSVLEWMMIVDGQG